MDEPVHPMRTGYYIVVKCALEEHCEDSSSLKT
jgi:hypothetical protein